MRAPNSGTTPGGSADAGRGTGEFAVIERIRRSLPGPPPGEVWIGDDAAVLAWGSRTLLLSTDLAVAGVHADLALVGVDVLGWRALAAGLSDMAAVGGRADHAVVGVAGPPSTDVERLYEGIGACARAHGCAVVGGDLSTASDLVVCATVTGHVPDDDRPVLRSGAHAGDRLFVTGALGAAAAGLRTLRARRHRSASIDTAADADADALVTAHCRPVARLPEGEAARVAAASAMIDVSDGLVADLWHLADASGVGFALDDVPVAPGATRDEALGGGEDYELVVATPEPARLEAAFARAGLRPLLAIGACIDDPRERTLGGRPVERTGWEHPWS